MRSSKKKESQATTSGKPEDISYNSFSEYSLNTSKRLITSGNIGKNDVSNNIADNSNFLDQSSISKAANYNNLTKALMMNQTSHVNETNLERS